MARRRTSPKGKGKSRTRVCPNCALIMDKPQKRCPRCNAPIAKGRDDNVADKASADSFPASDPPPYK